MLAMALLMTGCATFSSLEELNRFDLVVARIGKNSGVYADGDVRMWQPLIDNPDDCYRFLTDDHFAIQYLQNMHIQDYTLHTLPIEEIDQMAPPATPNLGS